MLHLKYDCTRQDVWFLYGLKLEFTEIIIVTCKTTGLYQNVMKKITLLVCFLVTSLSFAQVLENWDGAAPTIGFRNGAGSATRVADPTGGGRANVLRIITGAGDPWQQAELVLQGGLLLNMSTTNKRVAVDWYSLTPFDAMLGISQATGATAPTSTTEASHGGSGWETLTFDFTVVAQALPVPTANNYRKLFFFPHWNIAGNDFYNPFTASTTFVDVIRIPGLDTTWTGSVSTNWNTAGNWSNGVPTINNLAIIPNVANDPVAAGAVSVSGMTIASGAFVTVNGAVNNSGTIAVSSGASFIAKTSVSGTVSYERNLPSSNWHYISSPVVGQDVDNFVAASGLQSGGLDASLCTFDTAANDWNFYQIGTANADVLNPGEGYIVNLTAASGDITFSGTMNVGNVTKALATTGQGYNLLGNPYPSYIDSSAMLTASSGALLSQTIWVWDQTTNMYEVKVTADNFQLAPGQGFFIQSNGAAGNVTITEAFQSHQGADTFLRTAERTEVYLTLSNGSDTKQCKLYYMAGTTTGFDNGFDGPTFRAFPEPLSIYTHLVTNNFGMDIGLQSLPNDDYENLVVPVGVDALAGTEITISASALNLPVGIDIYLEDRAVNTFTVLNANSDFTLTPASDLNGTGRFYLHTNGDNLGLNENAIAYNLQIFTTDASKQVIIKGQLSSSITNAELFDLQGKLVFSKTLDPSRTTNTLDISGLSSGLYVVKVEGGNQSKTQKVLIK